MPFFSRPNLDNEQFKQLTGSTLHLSGVTHIATTSGLTLFNGSVNNIVITAKGAGTLTDGYVLTYDDSKREIGLCLSAASGGTQIYNGISPTTCTVGGLSSGTSISGKTLSCIIQDIVAPAVNPTIVAPSNTFSLSCSPSTSTGYYEIGAYICVSGNSTFSQGSINPQYASVCDKRSGPPNTYIYTGPFGTTNTSSIYLTNTTAFSYHNIAANETYTGRVTYDAGYPVKNSYGGTYLTALPAGTTSPALSATVSTLYPYFWGVSSTAPTAGQSLINGGTKVIDASTGSITINFNVNTPSKYLWFAIPTTSGLKVRWFGSNAPSTNTEPIPNGASGLFNTPNAPRTISGINSPTSLWTNVTYDFYITNYATNTYAGIVPYTITFTNS